MSSRAYRWLEKYSSPNLAIDLGTANTVIYNVKEGIVLNEPSLVVVDDNNEVIAIGNPAREMVGRLPEKMRCIRPLEDGVITDFEMCEQMLKHFLEKVINFRFLRPRMIFCVPSGVSRVEQGAVYEIAENVGVKSPAYIIEEPVAAAIGAGVEINFPSGNLVVDVGGGTTEVAVLSLGGTVSSHSARGVGGRRFTQRLIEYFEKEHDLELGENYAEAIKFELASACPLKKELETEITGRDLETGLPRRQQVSTIEIRAAIEEEVMNVVDAIRKVLDEDYTDPELMTDIIENGILLAGGGALLTGLCQRIEYETGIKTFTAEDPLNAVVKGSGQVLENSERYENLLNALGA